MTLDFTAIRDELSQLQAAGPLLDVFGSSAHRFVLNPVLTEAEVVAFEAAHRVTLPADYRGFLTQVGNGGAGPAYGLFPLGMMDSGHGLDHWQHKDGLVGVLFEPFLHTRPWNDLSGEPAYDESRAGDEGYEDEYDAQLRAWLDIYWRTTNVNGAIPICHLGCALRQWLVVTGPEVGNVWDDFRTDRRGLGPLGAIRSRVSFRQWYCDWLEDALHRAGIRPVGYDAPMTTDFARELDVALDAARIASDYLRREYATFTPVPDAPADISTHADKGAQELILRHLHAAFPADGLLAEEATDTLRTTGTGTSGRTWIVDPIDGTRGFASKNDQFSVMIGLAVNGRAVLGVVAEPVQHRVTYGVVGAGCFKRVGDDLAECRVSRVAELSAVCLARSVGKLGKPTLGERLLKPKTVITTHSAGIKLGLVARGEADVYVNDHSAYHDWDVCAGHALVEAAGGRVTGFAGEPVGYGAGGPRRTWGLVVSNGRVHDAVIQKLATEG